ncbi:MAG: hypothetical protein WDZ59_11050 [Pirellulales bacterium]
MWARVVEVMLGCWLIISPFIFGHPESEVGRWLTDMACGTLVIAFALLSYARPLRHAHLLTILVGFWLIGFAFLAEPYPVPPALQNDVMLGLLLLMMCILPNEATEPPLAWRRYADSQ